MRDLAGEPGVGLHLLASLAAEIEIRLPAAVATARSLGYGWAEISAVSGMGPERARRLAAIHAAGEQLSAAQLSAVPEPVLEQTPGDAGTPGRQSEAETTFAGETENPGPSTLPGAPTVWMPAQL
jgi:hypothetical protein